MRSHNVEFKKNNAPLAAPARLTQAQAARSEHGNGQWKSGLQKVQGDISQWPRLWGAHGPMGSVPCSAPGVWTTSAAQTQDGDPGVWEPEASVLEAEGLNR